MAESLGSLIDKLSIINIKLWFVQDWVIKTGTQTEGAFSSQPYEDIRAKILQLNDLNMERSGLVNEINALFQTAIDTRRADYAKVHKIKE